MQNDELRSVPHKIGEDIAPIIASSLNDGNNEINILNKYYNIYLSHWPKLEEPGCPSTQVFEEHLVCKHLVIIVVLCIVLHVCITIFVRAFTIVHLQN